MSSATINDFLQAITSSDTSKDELKNIYSSLVDFFNIISSNKEIKVFLTNDIYDSDSKLSIIKDIVGDSDSSMNFFKTVLDFEILDDLISSHDFFLKKLRKILDRVKIEVFVSSIDDNKKNSIMNELSDIWGSNLEVNFNVDPNIIGGIILQVEDKFYDGSIKGKIEKFNNI